MSTYSFTYTDDEGKTRTFDVNNADDSWPEMLNDFVKFMETIYDYPIKPKIRLQAPLWFKYFDYSYDVYDPWEDNYWYPDEEENEEEEDNDEDFKAGLDE